MTIVIFKADWLIPSHMTLIKLLFSLEKNVGVLQKLY